MTEYIAANEAEVWLVDNFACFAAPLAGIGRDGRVIVGGRSPRALDERETIIAVLPVGEAPTVAEVLRGYRHYALQLIDQDPDANGDEWAAYIDHFAAELSPKLLETAATTPNGWELIGDAQDRASALTDWHANGYTPAARARFVAAGIRAEVPDALEHEIADVSELVDVCALSIVGAADLLRARSDAQAESLLRAAVEAS